MTDARCRMQGWAARWFPVPANGKTSNDDALVKAQVSGSRPINESKDIRARKSHPIRRYTARQTTFFPSFRVSFSSAICSA